MRNFSKPYAAREDTKRLPTTVMREIFSEFRMPSRMGYVAKRLRRFSMRCAPGKSLPLVI